jgi:hypothetical protein
LGALALVAAACSSAPPVGTVGGTLAAMNGTVTLDKVISPAPVIFGSAQPAPGHKLVAVVLTVHSPTSAAAQFGSIYTNSKLVDSTKKAHVGKTTAKYKVYDCGIYPPFGAVPAGKDAAGCVVFQVAATALPVELEIRGKSEADWTIPATAVVAGTAPAPKATLYPRTTTTVPGEKIAGTTTTTISGLTGAATTTTAGPGTKAGTGTPSTTVAVAKKTTTTTAAGGSGSGGAHTAHHHVTAGAPKIGHLTPKGAATGGRVQILGRRLSGATLVTFNGVPAVVRKDGPGKIVAIVPEGATTGPITVTTPSGIARSPHNFDVF